MSESGLYLHVPFCEHKCGYCDFNSWAETRTEFQKQWSDTIIKQIEFWASSGEKKIFNTLFLGGGTPSLLRKEYLNAVLESLFERGLLEEGAEISAEANPETLTDEKLKDLQSAGVNRLSVGIQTFDNSGLQRLERKATEKTNLKALELVSQNWRGRWSLDLIFGTPEQSLEMWLSDLDKGLAFGPSHVSAYQLTLSTQRSKNWKQPHEDKLLEYFLVTEERLAEEGLKRYEVSNFAKPGSESLHNLHYWRMNPFLGLGPGAYGVVDKSWINSELDTQAGYHQKNASRWEVWLEGGGNAKIEESWLSSRSLEDHFKELVMTNLRLVEGMPLAKWGANSKIFVEGAAPLVSQGLLESFESEDKGDCYRTTTRGSHILDTVLELLFGLVDFSKIETN